MYPFRNNSESRQYEFDVDGKTPRVEYIIAGNRIYLTHTEVPKGLEGQGIGNAIIKKSLEDVKEKGYELIPLCPFVAAYIQRHPEWKSILKDGVSV